MQIEACKFIDPRGRIVDSASLLAAEVISRLRDHAEPIAISVAGLRSVCSSYFNTLLLAVAQAHGADALSDRLSFSFGSTAQRQIFQRSFDAILWDVA